MVMCLGDSARRCRVRWNLCAIVGQFGGISSFLCLFTALAAGEAEINLCVPGGDDGVRKLADLLGKEYIPMSGEAAVEKPKSTAVIDEATCIGCTLCIQACPVDAILGSAKHLHSVLQSECTGCELCVAPCPVDCISMVPVPETLTSWKWRYPVIQLKVKSA